MATVRGQTPYARLNLIDYDEVGWQDPMDENFYIIDALMQKFTAQHNIRGLWKNATLYNANDVVVDGATGFLWKAAVTHTSPSTGSFTANYSSQVWVDISTTVGQGPETFVTPEGFGAGLTADDAPSIQQSLQYAVTQRKAWRADGKYNLQTPVYVRFDSDQQLNAFGGHFFCDYNGSVAAITLHAPELETYVAVLTFEAINLSNNQPPGAVAFNTTKVSVTVPLDPEEGEPGTHSITVGDIVKVHSDDRGQQDTEDRFIGEFAHVVKVVGNDFWLSAPVRNSYFTNIRCTKFNKSAKLSWHGLRMTSDPTVNVSSGRKVTYLRIKGFTAPVLNEVRMSNITAAGIINEACIGAFSSQLYFNHGRNAASSEPGVAGYGYQDTSSEFTQIVGIHGQNLRHTYTTIHSTTVTTDPATYGEVFGCVVSNGTDFGSSAASFDTHAGSRGISFLNLVTSNPYVGETSAKAGIQLRGSEHFVGNCTHNGAGAGIKVIRDYAGVWTEHTIDGYKYNGLDYVIDCFNDTGSVLRIRNIDAKSYRDIMFRLKFCTLYASGLHVDFRSAVGGSLFYSAASSVIRAHGNNNTYVMAHGHTANRIVTFLGWATVELEGRVINQSTDWHSAVHCDDAVPDNTLFVRVNLIADRIPTFAYNGLSGLVNRNAASYIVAEGGPNRTNSAIEEISLSTINAVVPIRQSVARTIYVRVVCTTPGCTFNTIDVGYQAGQMLVIENNGASTQSFVVKNNHGGQIDLPADVTIAPKSALALCWNDFDWVGISSTVAVTGTPGVTDHGALSGLADDDHSHYLTDARFDTRFLTKSIFNLADVPDTPVALRYLQINAAGNAIQFQSNPVDGKLQALSTLLNDYFWFYLDGGQPRFLINNSADATKVAIGEDFSVIGGDRAQRFGTTTLTVVGAFHATGGIDTAIIAGDWENPAIIGNVYLWDGGGNQLRYKSPTAPASALDGSPLGASPVVRSIQASDITATTVYVPSTASITLAVGTYALKVRAIWRTSDVASGLSLRGLSTGTAVYSLHVGIARTPQTTGSTSSEWQVGYLGIGGGVFSGAASAAGSDIYAMFDATLVVTTGGTYGLEFKPEDSVTPATATLRANTYIEAEKIA